MSRSVDRSIACVGDLVTESRAVAGCAQRSPRGRPQKRPHEIHNAANCSKNSTSKPTPSLPWAQGVAGSNPVAPTNRINNLRPLVCGRFHALS